MPTSGLTVTTPLGDLRRGVAEVDEEAPEGLLGRGGAPVVAADVDGDGRRLLQLDRRRGVGRAAAAAQSSASGEPSAKGAQGSAASAPSVGRQLLPLGRRQQRRVVGRMPFGGEPARLDRVGEDDRGALVAASHARKASSRSTRSWPPRSRIARRSSASSRSAISLSTSRPAASRSPAGARAAPPASPRSSRWYSSFGIPSIRRRSASPPLRSKSSRRKRPYLTSDRLPAGGLEHRLDPPGGDVGDDPVERLPVEVDHPHQLAERRDHRVDQRLPDRPLVELGVAEQGDLAAGPRRLEVVDDVAVGDRAPDRRGGADADRAGGEVDRVGVLGPARVALQAAEGCAARSDRRGRARRAGS